LQSAFAAFLDGMAADATESVRRVATPIAKPDLSTPPAAVK
jgi:hypothetical protein